MSKGLKIIAAAAALAFGGLSTAANAQLYKAGDLTITGSIVGTSDYVFRGISQTAADPALQGTLDLTYKWFYAGVFASMVDFGDDAFGRRIATAEIDYYAGVKIPLTPRLEIDLGAIYYAYPGARDAAAELDYFEGKIGATFKPMDPLALTLVGYYSPEYTAETGGVFTLESGFAYTVGTFRNVGVAVSGLLGYQKGDEAAYRVLVNGDDSYLYWNFGTTFTFAERLSIDLRYHDTNISNTGNFCSGALFQCDERFVGTAKVTF